MQFFPVGIPVFPCPKPCVSIVTELRTEVNAQPLPKVDFEHDGKLEIADSPFTFDISAPVGKTLAGVQQIHIQAQSSVEAFFDKNTRIEARFVMGMGIGAAGAFGSIAQQVFAPAQNGFAPQQPTNPTQNAPSGRFTQKSAAPATPAGNAEDPMETLGKLKKLLDAGLIEPAEYDAKKAEILSRM